MIRKLEILCLVLGLSLGVACQNPPDDDDRPGSNTSGSVDCGDAQNQDQCAP